MTGDFWQAPRKAVSGDMGPTSDADREWMREVSAAAAYARSMSGPPEEPDTTDCPIVAEALLRERYPEWTRFASLTREAARTGKVGVYLAWSSGEAGAWLRQMVREGKVEARHTASSTGTARRGRRSEYRWVFPPTQRVDPMDILHDRV